MGTLGCPQDCVLGTWTDWSECSATCLGQRQRHRGISVQAANGGTECPENSEETFTEACVWEFCPPPTPVLTEAEQKQVEDADKPDNADDDVLESVLRGHANRRVGACMSALLVVLLSTQAI